MKLICSIALALAILIQPTRADFYYAVVGAISCVKIAQDYQQNPTEIGKVMMTWAQGFMSGANAALGKEPQRQQYSYLQAPHLQALQGIVAALTG